MRSIKPLWPAGLAVAMLVTGCAVTSEYRRAQSQGEAQSQQQLQFQGGAPGGPGPRSSPAAVSSMQSEMQAHRALQGVTRASRPVAALASPRRSEGATQARPILTLASSRPDRYLIRNATLTVEARDTRQASDQLLTAVQAAGGYVADSHESVDGLGRRSITIEARVPFTRFDHSLQRIEALGKVLEEQVTAEDVTEEFVDSQARRHNLQETEQRLLEHLHRTARLGDILLVEKELSRVRGEIEQLEGRLRFLEHRIQFSTLTVELREGPRSQPLVPSETYSSGKELAEAVRSLVAFGRVLWSGAIWLGVWAAVWGPVAFIGWSLYRRRPSVMRDA